MSHKLEVEEITNPEAGARIFRLDGTLTDSEKGFEFLERVRQAVREKPGRIILNLAKVDLLTSAGVGIIASCYISARNAGGSIALAELQARPRMVLNMVRLLTLIPDFESEQAALSATAGTPPS